MLTQSSHIKQQLYMSSINEDVKICPNSVSCHSRSSALLIIILYRYCTHSSASSEKEEQGNNICLLIGGYWSRCQKVSSQWRQGVLLHSL